MRLNIGAGSVEIPGFVAIDRKLGMEAFPLDVEDDSVDEIRCSHMLEHLSFADAKKAIEHWYRKLKRDGRLRLAVPDFDRIANRRDDVKWPLWLMGGQTDDDDFHRSCWTKRMLAGVMRQAGFRNIREWTSDGMDSSSLPISLNLEGYKVAEDDALDTNQQIKIAAVLGIPRVGWNDHWGAVVDALRPWNIPVRRHIGAFWGHNMQTVLEGCIADGLDWALTLDYDSLFTRRHLNRMIEIFGSRPDIDALAALQTKRGSGSPLCTASETSIEIDGNPFRANTAHFGMTLIRLDMLKELPKPWFWDQPSASGSWLDEDRIDCDIYFWRKWKEHGRTLYIAPDVRIGHLELMVSQMNEEMQQEHVHVCEWMKNRDS